MLSDAGRLGIKKKPKTNTFCLNYTKQLMDKKTHLNNHFEHPVGQREFGRFPGTHWLMLQSSSSPAKNKTPSSKRSCLADSSCH